MDWARRTDAGWRPMGKWPHTTRALLGLTLIWSATLAVLLLTGDGETGHLIGWMQVGMTVALGVVMWLVDNG